MLNFMGKDIMIPVVGKKYRIKTTGVISVTAENNPDKIVKCLKVCYDKTMKEHYIHSNLPVCSGIWAGDLTNV